MKGGGGGWRGLVAVVSMDLSKAIDVIQYPLLLSKLRAYGMGIVP